MKRFSKLNKIKQWKQLLIVLFLCLLMREKKLYNYYSIPIVLSKRAFVYFYQVEWKIEQYMIKTVY